MIPKNRRLDIELNSIPEAGGSNRSDGLYLDRDIRGFGSQIEAKKLELIDKLVEKRKKIRDMAVEKLDSLIIYCDNKILDLGNDYSIQKDFELKTTAMRWQQKIVDLEMAKVEEQKLMFKDTQMLWDKWMDAQLSILEEKKLDEMLEGMVQHSGFIP